MEELYITSFVQLDIDNWQNRFKNDLFQFHIKWSCIKKLFFKKISCFKKSNIFIYYQFESIDFKKFDPEFYEKLKESTAINNLNQIFDLSDFSEAQIAQYHEQHPKKKSSNSSIFSEHEERRSAFKPVRKTIVNKPASTSDGNSTDV